jgi:hypothetical protein
MGASLRGLEAVCPTVDLVVAMSLLTNRPLLPLLPPKQNMSKHVRDRIPHACIRDLDQYLSALIVLHDCLYVRLVRLNPLSPISGV